MALLTKCILAPIGHEDGLRISVMSRHTLSDGITPDHRITAESMELHMPSLAPSPQLIGDYYKRGLSWEDYESRFNKEMKDKISQLRAIASHALTRNITLLCIEPTPEHCHRRLLAVTCKRIEPHLKIVCK